ncbi:MAG: hypothetical protein ACOH1N_14205 [Lutibacter sp.]
MKQTAEITYKMSASDFESVLDKKLERMVQDLVLNPYSLSTVGITSACEIINVSKPTLYSYVKLKKIIPFSSDKTHKSLRFTIKALLEFNIARAKDRI